MALVGQQHEHWDRAAPPPALLEAALGLWASSGLDEAAFLDRLRRAMLRAAVLTVPAGDTRTACWLRAVAVPGGVGERPA